MQWHNEPVNQHGQKRIEHPANREQSIKIEQREPSKFEGGRSKLGILLPLEQQITIKPTTPESAAYSKGKRKETSASRTEVPFDISPRGPASLPEVTGTSRNSEGFGETVHGPTCMDTERPGHDEEPSLTAVNMLENLLADDWKPISLKLNVNDGDIQQRKRYLQQQRDRILAHKKVAREKQRRYFRQLESKADATPQKTKRPAQPTPILPRDTEANRKRETLRKELARRLKEELTKKSSVSFTSNQIHV